MMILQASVLVMHFVLPGYHTPTECQQAGAHYAEETHLHTDKVAKVEFECRPQSDLPPVAAAVVPPPPPPVVIADPGAAALALAVPAITGLVLGQIGHHHHDHYYGGGGGGYYRRGFVYARPTPYQYNHRR